MPCAHAIPAVRYSGSESGRLVLWPSFVQLRKLGDSDQLLMLPCGSCVYCRSVRARSWAIRCGLEMQYHLECCWATLTYDDDHLPPTLSKRHLSLFLKRLRDRLKPERVRFFACGEYGETTWRPHYHAILFGTSDAQAVRLSWPHGFSRVDPLSPAAISYVAGYCAKKLGAVDEAEERIDRSTGEVYRYQPPFILMSRRPGIGGEARVHDKSWRRSAVWDGREVPVPRYLHEAWKASATPEEVAALQAEFAREAREYDYDRAVAGEKIAEARLTKLSQSRKL